MSMEHANQLGIPPDPLGDPNAYEVARVWSSGGHQYYVLDVARYPEPAVWGMLAIDIMKHAARAYQQRDGRPKEETYKQILVGMMAEMQDPTEPL
jgi:hypothetical protein